MPPTFSEETAVEAGDRSGRYRAAFSEHWHGPRAPQGGVVTATTLRAMAQALDRPEHRLRTSTTVFVDTVPTGPAEVTVEVLRAGRSVSQVEGTVRGGGATGPGHRTLAVYGRERPGFDGTELDFTELEWPDPPPPETCPPLPEARPGPSIFDFTFWRNVDVGEISMRYPWEDDWTGGRAYGVRWIRYRDTPFLADGTVDPLAYVPLVDVIPGAVGQRLGPIRRRFFAPTLDLTVHFLDRTRDEWMLQEMRMRRATHGYGSGEMALWSRDGRLLAHASQTMLFALEDPVPPG